MFYINVWKIKKNTLSTSVEFCFYTEQRNVSRISDKEKKRPR
ncbi:unnamed protein product [Debaryomyces tyrocola]|nr:unnamed protein product [Debaryomyces tyrocola]